MDGDEAAKPGARKHKLSERDALYVHDKDAERDLRRAAQMFRDELLPVPYELLYADKKVKADRAEKKMFESLRYLLVRRKRLKLSKDDPLFNRTFFDADEHSVFESSQETEAATSEGDPPVYLAEDAPDEVLAAFQDDPGVILTQSTDSQGSEPPAQSTQAPSKNLAPLHSITSSAGRINRLKGYRKTMAEWARAETTTITEFCGLIIHHERYHPKKDEQGNVVEKADRELAKVGMAIFLNESVCKVYKATLVEGVFATDRLRLCSTGYSGLRKLVLDRMWWPPLNMVADFKQAMMRPKMYPNYMDGARAVLSDALAITIREFVQVALQGDDELRLSFSGEVDFKFTYGYDGSGQHPVFSMEVDTSSKVMGTYTVTEARDRHTGRWFHNAQERGHNSVVNSRPYVLVPRQESRDVMKDILQGSHGAPGLEAEIKEVRENGLFFLLPEPDNTPIKAYLVAEPVPSQQDDKMKKAICGIGGAYCTICTNSATTCKDPQAIAAGFPMDRNLEDIAQIAAMKRADPETGKIPDSAKRVGDYSGGANPRKGVTFEPITTAAGMLKVLPIMHAKIHAIDYLCDLLRRIISGVEFWFNPLMQDQRSYTPEESVNLKEAKTIVKEYVKANLGISVFIPNKQCTGNMFKTAAVDEARRKMASLIDDDVKRQSFLDIHLMLCAIVRVGNSQRSLIDFEFYREVATECYLKIVEDFPWAQVPESIHQVLAHLPDLVDDNGGYGLGNGSDEALERVNKEMRYWEARGSRTDSVQHNILDTFNHIWQYSSGLLPPLDKRMKMRNRAKRVIPSGSEDIDSLVRMMFLDGTIPPGAAADAE